ncbi:MAG TPA: DUF1932 domain-containing protein [Acidimicrobiales bacterium]|nr:DUF1932 domain-containing protein [Acidimicrobiales bacterium]
MRIGILHPGEMGAGIGGALAEAGHDVFWASEGRSAATSGRAADEGLIDLGSVVAVVAAAEVIFSVCPPHAAVDVANEVAGFDGLYLDANAIAPATAAEVAYVIESAGGNYLDGGIVGAPPKPGRPTKLYLSGAAAEELASALEGANLDCRVLSARPGDASALKAAYAAWTKGTSALILSVRSLARSFGIEEALVTEWADSQPGLDARASAAAQQAATKGWRWIGEMEEIAKTFEAVGLPGGFHHAAAEIYRRCRHDDTATSLDEVLGDLSQPEPS